MKEIVRWVSLLSMFVLLTFMACTKSVMNKLLIAACGDSITFSSYGSYLPALRLALQNAGYKVEIDEYARPGNNSCEYLRFLKKEGLSARKYDYLLVMLGTNDVRIDGDYQDLNSFSNNIEKIIIFLKSRYPEAKIVLITPPPIFEIDLPTFNEKSCKRLQEEVAPALKALSLKNKIDFIDLQQELAKKVISFQGFIPIRVVFAQLVELWRVISFNSRKCQLKVERNYFFSGKICRLSGVKSFLSDWREISN